MSFFEDLADIIADVIEDPSDIVDTIKDKVSDLLDSDKATELTDTNIINDLSCGYNPSFGNKELPSSAVINKKSGTSDTFLIKIGQKIAEVRGGDKTVKIDNIVYNLPKLK